MPVRFWNGDVASSLLWMMVRGLELELRASGIEVLLLYLRCGCHFDYPVRGTRRASNRLADAACPILSPDNEECMIGIAVIRFEYRSNCFALSCLDIEFQRLLVMFGLFLVLHA